MGNYWDYWWHFLLNVLVMINSVVHYPVLSIVLFTLVIKLLTLPLTLKSLRSTRNMQQIQPLIKEIQKKYGKDKQKQQEETMRIYHQYGVNPAAGCFPMLVQLPIFFGLYSALTNTIAHGTDASWLHGVLYSFVPASAANFDVPFLWIGNLSKPDPIYALPLLSGLFQFLQSRMAMPVRDPNSPPDPQQRMMNNMMQFMPLYIIFISANFPAGVVIYWLFSNVISVVQQYFITGWGSLPSFPGFGWLPKKPHVVPEPPPPPPALPEGVAPARKGLMSRMMAKAIEAQEAQKAVQSGSTATALAATGEVERVKRKGSETQIRPVRPEPAPRVVPSTSMKYASDLKRRASVEVGVEGISGINGGNGADHTGGIPSPSSASHLPRKRKNRK